MLVVMTFAKGFGAGDVNVCASQHGVVQGMCLRFVDGAWEVAAEASKQTDPKSPVGSEWGSDTVCRW